MPADACEGLEDRSCAAIERFLRARKYDVPVAAAMFVEHRRWRASFAPTPWVQGPDNVATQLAQRKVAMQGLCRDALPFVIVIARNHFPTGREGVPELHRAFVYIMDCITSAAGPGACLNRRLRIAQLLTPTCAVRCPSRRRHVSYPGRPAPHEHCKRRSERHESRL